MIKNTFKIIFISLLIILSIVFYKQRSQTEVWGSYTPIILQSNLDVDRSIDLLSQLGLDDVLYKKLITLGINNYTEIEEKSLDQIELSLDKNDYRYDPFIDNINSLFTTSNSDETIIYVKIDKKNLILIFNLYKTFNDSVITMKLGEPLFLRTILNYLCIFILFLLFASGCKTRFIITIISGIITFFFMDASSVYSFIGFFIIYFLIIMVVESISFSNRYIKRNNIGFIRIGLTLILFSMPTIFPLFLDYSDVLYTPRSTPEVIIDYVSLENEWNESSANLSNYYAHYVFQKTFLYGEKYIFPIYGNSVTIDEFKREDYYLSRYEKVVLNYDEEFFQEFLSYCNTTALGRFFIDYGRPFTLELNSLLSLYINENEYMFIGLLTMTMLFASLVFKKNGDKKLKY